MDVRSFCEYEYIQLSQKGSPQEIANVCDAWRDYVKKYTGITGSAVTAKVYMTRILTYTIHSSMREKEIAELAGYLEAQRRRDNERYSFHENKEAVIAWLNAQDVLDIIDLFQDTYSST